MYYKNAKLYPITYHSGTFSPTQVNWSANTKEAYAIFRSITRMSFFVTDSEVIVHSDHKPLKKFIEGVTANPRVTRLGIVLPLNSQKAIHRIHKRIRERPCVMF